MEKIAAAFIEEMKGKSHLMNLFRDSSFLICIKAENEEIPFEFRDGYIYINSTGKYQSYDAIISGSKEDIQTVLTGKEKLREAIKFKKISVETTFRKLLMLESLFFLCKS